MKGLILTALQQSQNSSPNSKNNEQLTSPIQIAQVAAHLNAFRPQEKERLQEVLIRFHSCWDISMAELIDKADTNNSICRAQCYI